MQFRGASQQDSQEFLRQLLDALSLDLNEIKIKPKYLELKSDPKKDPNQIVPFY